MYRYVIAIALLAMLHHHLRGDFKCTLAVPRVTVCPANLSPPPHSCLSDTQHGPVDYSTLHNMLAATSAGKAKRIVRVGGPDDRYGMQQALE